MSTNVEFKSNVYPIDGSIQSDKVFLSKIHDHYKLRGLDRQYFQLKTNSVWSEFQQTVIDETPTCALDMSHDPCWGMVKSINGYHWECRCVNTMCKHFNKCRKFFDQTEFEQFSPIVNLLKGYKYNFSENEEVFYPISYLDSNAFYEEFTKQQKNKLSTNKETDSFDDETVYVQIVKVMERNEEARRIISEQENDNENIVDDSSIEEKIATKETESEVVATAQYRTQSLDEIPSNIFDYFEQVEQKEIITVSPSDVIFVDAGPGTGKTYTLIQKINYLVKEYEVEPESILVLCFTNAAVDEIRDRLYEFIREGGHRGLANVDIRTFHSFAWWLIGQANESFTEDGWQRVSMGNLSYDESLRIATQIVRKFSSQVFESWGHFIVDEVQDLTNNLARFVLHIVNACLNAKCGITVLGDSCQAIYDYTQEGTNNPLTSEEFYKALFRKFYGIARFVRLSVNHRQSDELINMTSKFRESILNQSLIQMTAEVSRVLNSVKYISKTALEIQEDELMQLSNSGKICLLFRNNGQTLKMSSTLRKRGIRHILNAFETHQNFALWIAEVFYQYKNLTISYDKFELTYEKAISKNKDISAETIWKRIQKLMHSQNDSLQVSDLLQAIINSKIDDSIFRTKNDGNIIVSNIHRAKGREYECVIVDANFPETLISNQREIGEYKTMYVAVTRPKKSLLTASFSKTEDLRLITIYNSQRKRWGKIADKKIKYFEVNSSLDIDVNTYLTCDQSYLLGIKEGDPIELKRVLGSNAVDYDIIHYAEDSPTKIGRIGKTYIEDLISCMHISNSRLVEMPASIDDIYVSGVYTHIATDDFLKLNPQIGEKTLHGVWIWVEFAGVGHANYDVY